MEPLATGVLRGLPASGDSEEDPLLQGGSRRPHLEPRQEGGSGRRRCVITAAPQGTQEGHGHGLMQTLLIYITLLVSPSLLNLSVDRGTSKFSAHVPSQWHLPLSGPLGGPLP